MRAYALRRLGQAALTLLGVSVLVFVVLRVLPGDPAKMLLPEGAPQSAVDELNRHLGLREPLHVQYAIFIQSVFRGDFGQSFQYRAPALQVVTESEVRAIRAGEVELLLANGTCSVLPNDEVFVFVGGTTPVDLLERSGVSFDPALRAKPRL